MNSTGVREAARAAERAPQPARRMTIAGSTPASFFGKDKRR